ncbi:type VI secretion system Vgr family protein [Massilia yuzhufengensis]|uniref:Rhs element Vgr protein n=1 Tax=Massilia yuzhufengensis TaxID=1164594 RepID=A0A1I1I063_9BURK|nr:type VI secretion system Vgr family protein [Massilia yuzhufengensis]SFC29819.1 Rhs element Vgr protein [Massilia yuzhufengensis]
MSTALTDHIFAALAEFSSASRLYAFKIGDGEEGGLLVEAFLADDALQALGIRDVIALSTDANLELDRLLGQPAVLEASLADGTRARFGGEISEAAMLGSDGGLARYRIRMSSWLWRLGQVRNCRVWQDKRVVDIVDAVFDAYLPLARWRWSDETGSFMADVPPRSYCCQYRESDLDFVRRLLAEEGLCWRVEQTDAGPGLVLFADSSQDCAVPEDASSAALGGIRFHGARSVEESDSIQALTAQRRLHASMTTLLSDDYKARQVVAASSPSHYTHSKLPALEDYDVPGQYAFSDRQQAQHYADLQMEGQEARGQLWHGRSTVRTLRAGTCMHVLGAPLQQLAESASFTVLRVVSIGVNNMPPAAQHALAELFGPIPELLEDVVRSDMPDELALAIGQARSTGYANCFSAVATGIVWRPQLEGGGSRPKPVAFGAHSAIVVGADGNDQPSGADELYCDRLGRVRIRFHWQESGNATCWVRVAQRSAGGGMGQQFLPRIGQEVLVQFLENDIDRPVVVGAFYNGQGEGGVVATPGGRRDSDADLSCFEAAHDHSASGQGNLSGGNSPVWHGASADSAGHRNPTVQWGIRSKEFGGYGYSQLVFDDTDGQGRVQLRSTHAGSELNFGHLVHSSDNYRGSFRGLGAEVRTDASGVLRAAAGLLVSSSKVDHSALKRDPLGESRLAIELLTKLNALGDAFSSAAKTHETVVLAAHVGAAKPDESKLDSTAAPLKAMLTGMSGQGNSHDFQRALAEAAAKSTKADDKGIPYLTDPIIELAGQVVFGLIAAQSVQLSSGEVVILTSGQDTQVATAKQIRVQSKQALGVLGGAKKPPAAEMGLQLIASKDGVDIQSQGDDLKANARDELVIVSVVSYVDFAASKKISLTTAGGANVTIDGGNISLSCPRKLIIQAGKKSFTQPEKLSYPLPVLPSNVCVECLMKARNAGSPFVVRFT